jgi:hypothetical protein
MKDTITKKFINNFLPQLSAFLLLLIVMPFTAFLPSVIFLTVVVLFIICTSLLVKQKTLFTNYENATIRDVAWSIIINIFFLLVYALIAKLLIILLGKIISDSIRWTITACLIYFLLFLFLIQNVQFRSPGFVIMNLTIPSHGLRDKMKILLRNIFHIMIIYIPLFGKKYEIDNNLTKVITEIILVFVIINIIAYLFLFKDISLVDKVFNQRIKKYTWHKVTQ